MDDRHPAGPVFESGGVFQARSGSRLVLRFSFNLVTQTVPGGRWNSPSVVRLRSAMINDPGKHRVKEGGI